MSDIEHAWIILARLTARGFVVNLTMDRDGCQRVWAHAGDCNCPHNKLYDQTDGHGFIRLDSEDWDEWLADDADFNVLNAMQMLERKINDAYAKAPVAEMTRHQPAKLDDGGSSPSGGST